MALGTALAIVVALAFASVAYLLVVRRVYRLAGSRPEPRMARTHDGWEIAVHHRPPGRRRFREPVLLCHGLATNHLNFDFSPPYSLAHALAEAGFEVYSLDWRGAGDSRPPKGRGRFDFDADDLIEHDAPAVLDLPGSGAVLADLARSNLLLVPLDHRGQWYRCHHLFRDMLLAELERLEPA